MAKEIKCETYRQRCEFLGKDAQVFDMLLSHNGILVPAPIVKTILVEWEQYKKDGDLHLSEMARIRKESYDAYHEVITEIADVQIMTEQLAEMFNFSTNVIGKLAYSTCYMKCRLIYDKNQLKR